MTCSMPQRTAPRPRLEPGTPWSVIRGPNYCDSPSPIILASPSKVRIPTLRRTMPELYRFLLYAEHNKPVVSLPLCETMISRDAFGLSGPETGFQNMFIYSISFMRNNNRILKQVKQTYSPHLWFNHQNGDVGRKRTQI